MHAFPQKKLWHEIIVVYPATWTSYCCANFQITIISLWVKRAVMQAKSCKQSHASKVMQAKSCKQSHASKVMQAKSCKQSHASKVMQAKSCKQSHASKVMQAKSCKQSHASKVMQAKSSSKVIKQSHQAKSCKQSHASSSVVSDEWLISRRLLVTDTVSRSCLPKTTGSYHYPNPPKCVPYILEHLFDHWLRSQSSLIPYKLFSLAANIDPNAISSLFILIVTLHTSITVMIMIWIYTKHNYSYILLMHTSTRQSCNTE